MVTDNLLLHFPDMLIHTVGITPSLLNAVSSKLSYVASMMTDSLPEVNRARVHYLELCNSQAFHLLWLVDVLYNLLNPVAFTITRDRSTRIQTILGKGDQYWLLVLVCLDQFLPWTKVFIVGQSEEIGEVHVAISAT